LGRGDKELFVVKSEFDVLRKPYVPRELPKKNVHRGRFDLKKYLLERKSVIDRAVEQYLKLDDPVSTPLHEALHYSASDGGKRFRPVLALAVSELFDAERSAVVPFASALELIHCYSLIHDDLPALDNDDMRRGKPSCHKRFGEAMALLAGDTLLTEAFFIMSDPKLTELLPRPTILKVIREIAEAASIRGMIGGQNMEMHLGNQLTAELLEGVDRLKTGAMITAAARVGAIIGGANQRDLDRITKYARALGLAFQITDDILDAPDGSDTTSSTKQIANYLSILGPAEASRRVQTLLAECLEQMEPYGEAAEPLRGIARFVATRES
jgi:geranylgeranyl diphosphate synthase type II